MSENISNSGRDKLSAVKQSLLEKVLRREPVAPAEEEVIRRRDDAGAAPLSFAQQRLWFLSQLQTTPSFYSLSRKFLLKGALDLAALELSLKEIVRRHEALRTTFHFRDGQPVQVVAPEPQAALLVNDLSGLPEETRAEEARRLTDLEARRPFDLAQGPLFRASLTRLGEREHLLLFSMHHIVTDGWSMGILFRELSSLYDAFCSGGGSPLPELSVQYSDYAVWERGWLRGPRVERQLAYWQKKLGDSPPVLALPSDRPRPPVLSFRGAKQTLTIDLALADRLRALSRSEDVTLFILLLTAFKVLLGRYTHQADISVGTPTANRHHTQVEGLIGFFANTLVVRTDLGGDPIFGELLRQVRETCLEAYAHQDVPFEKVVEELQPERSLSYTPLFQVMFALQNATQEPLHLRGLDAQPVEVDTGNTAFDLTLVAEERPTGLNLVLQYSTDLFDSATAARLLGHYRNLLEALTLHSDQRISELPLLSLSERYHLLVERNLPMEVFPVQLCVHQLFEAQAARRPGAVALSGTGEEVTYDELNGRANRLARHLRTLGVGPEVLVGVYAERSLELVVAILAVLKAGGAYLPLDTAYPPERLAFMIEDAAAPVVLTQRRLLDSLPRSGVRTFCLDTDWELLADESASNPPPLASPSNLAYVIYTSGSTGRPKGVQVSHANVARLLSATEPWFDFGEQDVWTLFHSHAFDFSVWELWGALAYGGRLVVVPYLVSRSPEAFYELLREQRVTVLNQTPSAFRQLMWADEAGTGGAELALRLVIFGGEALDLASLRPWVERHGDERPQLVNMYGITETTVHVTYRRLRRAEIEWGAGSLIGVRIPDLQIYVLDEHLSPTPLGVSGEMYVGGGGVARGYVNRPELMAERFVAHPFSDEPGARLYRTGDLARPLADGDLEYLGRIDHQVKVRGFRIELGEIESVLREHPAVREAAVMLREDRPGDKRLVAYVVPGPQRAAAVRQALRLRREGAFDNCSLGELPNGMAVAYFNRSEVEFLYRELFEEQSYLLQHGLTLEAGDCVFDVGANIGMFSLFISRMVKDLLIYAFEPIPSVYELLKTNARLHDLNVKLFEVGLAGRSGSEIFTYYPHVSVISGRFADQQEESAVVKSFLLNELSAERSQTALTDAELDELLAARLTTERIVCPLKTISEVMRENGLERIDLLKIDVEKSERDVLAGIADDDWPKVRQIVVEVHGLDGRLAEVTSMLKARGYEVNVRQLTALEGTGLYDVYAVRPRGEHAAAGNGQGVESEGVPAGWGSEASLVGDLRRCAQEKLPDYMVPAAFVLLEELPLTANGKLNLRALPAPEREECALTETFVAPRTPTEEGLAEIWRQVLNVKRVGVHDNFFEAGGHSLLAAHLVSRVRAMFRIDLPLRSLFESPTVAGMAGEVEAAPRLEQGGGAPPLTPIPRDRQLPLSIDQEAWFIRREQWEGSQEGQNRPFVTGATYRLSGALDVQAAERALNEIVRRHEILRTTFTLDSLPPAQLIAPTLKLPLPVYDLSALDEAAQEAESRRLFNEAKMTPFDYAGGPLLRMFIVRLGADEYRAYVVVSHLIADGVSMNIFTREFSALYDAFHRSLPSPLPELPVQYADFASWQRDLMQGETLMRLIGYWQQRLANVGIIPGLELPFTRRDAPPDGGTPAKREVALTPELYRALQETSHRAGVTPFVLLLASLQALLHLYTDRDEIGVVIPNANRSLPETQGLIGWFYNAQIINNTFDTEQTFSDLLRQVREVVLGAFTHQDIPYSLLCGVLLPQAQNAELLKSFFSVPYVFFDMLREAEPVRLSGLTITPLNITNRAAESGIGVGIMEGAAGMSIHVNYRTDMYEDAGVERLLADYVALLERLVHNLEVKLSELRPEVAPSRGPATPQAAPVG